MTVVATNLSHGKVRQKILNIHDHSETHINTRSCAIYLHPHSHPLVNNHDQGDDVSYQKRRLKQEETGTIDLQSSIVS